MAGWPSKWWTTAALRALDSCRSHEVRGVTQALAEPNEGLPSGPVAEIPTLIINKPYRQPTLYWQYDPATQLFDLKCGWRPAGYVRATPGYKPWNDPGTFVP